MAKFKARKKAERILGNRTLIIIGVIILVFLSIALGKELLRRYEINREINQLETEISQLEERNLDLDELIEYFNTNSFVEKEAREKLGMQKEGETMVIINNDNQVIINNQPVEASGQSVSGSEELTNPQRWWNYFFN